MSRHKNLSHIIKDSEYDDAYYDEDYGGYGDEADEEYYAELKKKKKEKKDNKKPKGNIR